MKRIIIYIAVLAAALLVPARGTDIGKLLPVEVVSIYKEDGWVVLETDTQDSGRGRMVEEAIQNLKDTTAGMVFLDTADYLLVAPSASETAKELRAYLKDSVLVCTGEGEISLEAAAEFLAVHPPEVTLKDYRSTSGVQVLKEENGRMILK